MIIWDYILKIFINYKFIIWTNFENIFLKEIEVNRFCSSKLNRTIKIKKGRRNKGSFYLDTTTCIQFSCSSIFFALAFTVIISLLLIFFFNITLFFFFLFCFNHFVKLIIALQLPDSPP